MNPLEPSALDVRVDLRRGDVRMAEHGLDRAQIRTAVQEMSGERMAQHVRGNRRLDSSRASPGPKNLPESLARHTGPPAREEDVG